MTKLLVLLATCLVAASGGMVRRGAPAQPPSASALAEVQQHAAAFQQTFSETLNQLAGSNSSQQLNKALKEGSDAILTQLSSFSASLQAALSDANGKAADALKSAQGGLQAAADQLRREHPDVEQNAARLREQLTAAVAQVARHSQALAKDVAASADSANQKLAPQIKDAYDSFVKQAQQVQAELHKAATANAAH